MPLRTKLTIGLGFLFFIIFVLAIYSSYSIQTLSNEAEKIIKDNYESLIYCKNMLLALDDMRAAVERPKLTGVSFFDSRLFDASRQTFERNLDLERKNITELHERDYVDELVKNYGIFWNACLQMNTPRKSSLAISFDFISSYTGARQSVVNINDLNMEAVERKSLSTQHDSRSMIVSVAAVGIVCVLLAFFYFWYFPFYISNTLAYLTSKMRELLKNAGIMINVKTKDETFVLLQSINLLENKFGKNKEITN
ncbi:MAG: hypothetical protein ACLQCB_00855 [Spirochaetia bacterium]